MRKFKVAIIGTGGRSRAYAYTYAQCNEIEIVALADPVAEHRKALATKSGLTNRYSEYDDWRDMLEHHKDLDGVVITTPSFLHAEQAVACLERGLPVALEKPLATTKEDCERIIDTQRATGGRVLVGFVLRSTPLYRKIHDLIREGSIGQIVSIQADELPGWGVTSIMNRSPWRRYKALSGDSMLEKSCHDMDIINWMMESRPISLNSYGGQLIFRPNPELPETCDECSVTDSCQYYKKPVFSRHEDKSEEIIHEFIREDNLCIYNIEKDVVDVQSVNIEYENGAVANFMLNFNCSGPRSGRNFHAIGQKGHIWGNPQEKKVFAFSNLKNGFVVYDTASNSSWRSGGNRPHALELLKMMADPHYRPDQNVYAGYLSAMMCFGADISRDERRRVEFVYRTDGYIDIS
jgi:predicted dehydrogenase